MNLNEVIVFILGIFQFIVSGVATVLMCILVFKVTVRIINTIKMKGPDNVDESGREIVESRNQGE